MPNDTIAGEASVNKADSIWLSKKAYSAALLWYLVALAAIAVDQLTKYLADTGLSYNQAWELTWFFNLTLRYNPGAAFSFLANESGWQRWFFTGISVVVSLGLVAWIAKVNAEAKKLECWAFALILGGAVGNLIDRAFYGHVIDFLEFHYQDWYFPAFNIADSCICVGAGLLILDMLLSNKKS